MRTDTKFLKFILVLSILGILLSGWLLSMHVKFATGQAMLTESCTMIPGATSGQGCAAVAVSSFSDILGIPLASIAMGFYFTLLLLGFWAMNNTQASYEAIHVAFFLSTLSILVTVTMAFISQVILKSFCIGCSGLWMVNLALWPCLVKHMNLRWGNALNANLELFRPKNYQLLRGRVKTAFFTGMVCVAIFATIGVVTKKMQTDDKLFGGEEHALESYNNGQIVFLPPEAFGGPQSKGDSTAPVLDIVEFSDLQCPACRMAAQFLKPFLLKHAKQVRFTYHHFPLDGACNSFVPNGMHPFGCAAARAGICAAKQNSFFEYHDLVFDNQEALSNSLLEDLAHVAGLDTNAFVNCLHDKDTETELQKQILWGERIGLESTPTLVINGHKILGALSPTQLEALFQLISSHAH